MEADVDEANVARLRHGQPAEVTVEAFPDRKRYKAVLRQIIPTADRTKATVMVKVTHAREGRGAETRDEREGDVLEPEAAATPRAPTAPKPYPGAADGRRHARRRRQVFVVDGKAPGAIGDARRDAAGPAVIIDGLGGTETIARSSGRPGARATAATS